MDVVVVGVPVKIRKQNISFLSTTAKWEEEEKLLFIRVLPLQKKIQII